MYVSKRVQLTEWATALWKIEFWFFNFACIRTSLDFCFFLTLSVWMSVPVSNIFMTHCMCIYFSSLLRVSYSLSLWISVLVFGYIVTHWTCICTSLRPYLSLFSLWMPLKIFSYIVTDRTCIVSSLGSHFCLCFSLSVSVNACITANIACICTSLYPCFCLFLCLNVYSSVRIYYHSFLVYMYVSWSVFLSLFSVIVYICVRLYCHWLYGYRYVSYSASLSICLSLCLSECPGILSIICMYVSKRVEVAQCVEAL